MRYALLPRCVQQQLRDLTCNSVRRGVFRSVPELIATIDGYIAQHNQQPKPFVWTAKAADILAKVMRGRATLNTVQSV